MATDLFHYKDKRLMGQLFYFVQKFVVRLKTKRRSFFFNNNTFSHICLFFNSKRHNTLFNTITGCFEVNILEASSRNVGIKMLCNQNDV